MHTLCLNRRRTYKTLRWLSALILSSALTPLLPLNSTPAYAASHANNPAIQSAAPRQPARLLDGTACEGYAPIGGTCTSLASAEISLLGDIVCPTGYAPIGGTCVPLVPQASLLGDVGCTGYAPIGGTCVGTGTGDRAMRSGQGSYTGYAQIGDTSAADANRGIKRLKSSNDE